MTGHAGKSDSGCRDKGSHSYRDGDGGGGGPQGPSGSPPQPRGPGKRFLRELETPPSAPRTQLHDVPDPLSEVILDRPGQVPVRVVVSRREATFELIDRLQSELKDLPRLPLAKGQGAVDIRLEGPDGEQVKAGAVVLSGASGNIMVPLDPTTRRFRAGSLPAGEYQVRAASSTSGRAMMKLVVREGDVMRTAIRLDGSPPRGTTKVRFAVKGAHADQVRVRAWDRNSGRLVFDDKVKVVNGVIQLDRFTFGNIHWRIDDDEATSCYDTDVNDLFDVLDLVNLPELVLKPKRIIPDPPDWRFAGLPLEYAGVARVLPELGIHSLEELAAVEPEDLFHRALNSRDKRGMPVHSRLFGRAVNAARTLLGAKRAAGEDRAQIRLAQGATYARSFMAGSPGEAEFAVDIGPGNQAELLLQGPHGVEKRNVMGTERIRLTITPEDVTSAAQYQLTLTNLSENSLTGIVHTQLPQDRLVPGFTFYLATVTQQIETLLRALAVHNPGLGTTVPEAIMAPENIRMWIDHAQTFMAAAGVCSMNDLGRFRLDPMRKLQTGAYLAPVVQPPKIIPPLKHYAFVDLLDNTVLYYRPNDVLHDTAVVLAGEWDIRGQQIIIGQGVRELVVIAGSIRHDAASRISWELPALPAPNAYWPNPAPHGTNGSGAGAAGQDGGDGDASPHPSKNGGADAVTPAPIVTMYLLDATGNLPPIELNGQQGGMGGRGQDGGRGGDGAQGLRADGTFFGGCCRSVGFGGNGGQGGDGGRGGKGGRGGDGGRVTILTTPPGLAVMAAAPPVIKVNPGPGGFGGLAGNPGAGGAGGPAGTADCETWCDELPERRGTNGAGGAAGTEGLPGDPYSQTVLEDAIQFLPITEEQWQQEFNKPHILSLNVYDAEPGEVVQITGQNFDPSIDHVYFDGVNVGPVASGTQASFTVPQDSEGGYHPVVIRPSGVTERRSNRAMLRVLPKLDEIVPGTRLVENQSFTLTGLAFRPGLQIFAEDRSVNPPNAFSLPVIDVTRTAINIQVPGGFLGALRGVRRIVVHNPDGGRSRAEQVVRISDTIVVRCAAFRVVGTTGGVGTTRSVADITNLFNEGAVNSISIPWLQARIVFRLVQPVGTVTVADNMANIWPGLNTTTDTNIFNTAPGVLGALNFFFVRDVDISTAYAYFGGGPLFIGDEGGPLGPVDWQQVVAHEVGHALCLRHQCDGGEGPGTFFNRACGDGDEAFLMYPFWDASDGMQLHAGQVDPARTGATNFEDGKTASLPVASLFQLNVPTAVAQCLAADTQN